MVVFNVESVLASLGSHIREREPVAVEELSKEVLVL
jgi:hypothetical protein